MMGRRGALTVRRVPLATIGAAVGLVAAGLALQGSGHVGAPTFRDAAYGVSYKHHVKLTGVVVGFNNCQIKGCPHGTVISIRKRGKKVGQWTGEGNSVGFGAGAQSTWGGTGTMKIGTLKGKVRVSMGCKNVANPPGVGTITPYQLGVVGKSEGISMHNHSCPPATKGKKFIFTLSY